MRAVMIVWLVIHDEGTSAVAEYSVGGVYATAEAAYSAVFDAEPKPRQPSHVEAWDVQE